MADLKIRRLRVGAVFGVCIIVGGAMLIVALRTYTPLDHDLCERVAGTLFLIWLAFAFYVQSPARYGLRFAKVSFALLAFAPAVMATAIGVNGAFDLSTPKQQSAVVTKLWTRRGKGNAISYHLGVSAWRRGREVEQFAISQDLYSQLHFGDAVSVELREGFLRIPWVAAIQPR